MIIEGTHPLYVRPIVRRRNPPPPTPEPSGFGKASQKQIDAMKISASITVPWLSPEQNESLTPFGRNVMAQTNAGRVMQNDRGQMFAAGTAAFGTRMPGGAVPLTEYLGAGAYSLSHNALGIASRVPTTIEPNPVSPTGAWWTPRPQGPRFGNVNLTPGQPRSVMEYVAGHELFHAIDQATGFSLSRRALAGATPEQVINMGRSYGGRSAEALARYTASLVTPATEFAPQLVASSLLNANAMQSNYPSLAPIYSPWLRRNPPTLTYRPTTRLLQSLK